MLDEYPLPAILRRLLRFSEFSLEGARNSEKAELVSPRISLPLPLEHADPACICISFSRQHIATCTNYREK